MVGVAVIPPLKEVEAEGAQIQGQLGLPPSATLLTQSLTCLLAGGLKLPFGFLSRPVTFSHDSFLFFWFPFSAQR